MLLYLKDAGRDENVPKTPPLFGKNYKGKTVKRFKPEEFGLSKHERFQPAVDFFSDSTIIYSFHCGLIIIF